MRRSLPIAIAAAVTIVALATLAGVGRPEAAHGDTAIPDTVVTVGHGVVTSVPDEAVVTAGVHTEGATAAAALAENSKSMNEVIAALKGAGGTELQTQQVSLYPKSDQKGAITGYAADNSVSAKAKIAGAGALIDAAVGAGANTVNGPTLDVSNSDALYRDALGKAVDDARAKAQALGKAGGFGVGPVSVVVEQSTTTQPIFQADSAVAKSASTPIEPGTRDITADVSVTFRIS
jgi:uncharacterized protein YggE